MIVKPLYDRELIYWVMQETLDKCMDDNTGDAFNPPPPDDLSLLYLGCYIGVEFIGIVVLSRINGVMWDSHMALIKSGYGVIAAKKCIEWMFDNTDCKRIVTFTPSYNRPALRVARNTGMTEFGINKNAVQKSGNIFDLHCFGISKG